MPENVHIVVNKHTPYVVQAFNKIGKVSALDSCEITKESVRDADILIVRSETRVDANLLEGSNVKFVGTVTIGTDHVDEEYLKKNGITFVSAPGSNANSVSEYVTAALLELSLRLSFSLHKKTLGIVGVGNVGSKVWRKAEALGMRVLLNDPPLQRQGSKLPLHSLDEIMEADIITLHVPFTRTGQDSTYHFFDETRIGKMKRNAILINTSRGGVVETEGLKRALIEKHLLTAVLDVWEKEPNIDTALLNLALFGTPHIAGYSLDGKINALRMNYDAVCNFLSIPVDQYIDSLIPDPALPGIRVDTIQTPTEKILRDVVEKCYDISLDDKLLRKVLSLDGQERGMYFSKLRAEYRVRREFFNTKLTVSDELKDVKNIFQQLGFKVIN